LNGLFGGGDPPPPGIRNQIEVGVQQGLGRWVVADFGYFNKHTQNGYDFGVLFNTPIAFPVAWDHSRIDGFTGRLNLSSTEASVRSSSWHTPMRFYSPPGTAGFSSRSRPEIFRIDHDQKFNSTTNLQYVFEKRVGAWAALSWRYDSGLVAGSVGSLEDALGLTADQQTAIGFSCGGVAATLSSPLTAATCTSSNYSASRLRIPRKGRGRRDKPAADCASQFIRPGTRRRQPVPLGQSKGAPALQRDQPDQQGSPVQFSCRRSAARIS